MVLPFHLNRSLNLLPQRFFDNLSLVVHLSVMLGMNLSS